jgi:putative ABC transport system ATP-binding protein
MILARNISQTYESAGRSLTVLSPMDLTIDAREIAAIVGPSGSGKTTLLGLLAGLDLPGTGSVTIDGQVLEKLSEDQRAALRAEKIGFVFQSFLILTTLKAHENVMVPIELIGRSHEDTRGSPEERATALLDRVGLGDRLDHYPIQLSGGEQQRVALARAFVNDPRILFADEPTGNLDADNGAVIVDLLMNMNRELATTLVLVTHDPVIAERAARVIRLEGGRIVSDIRNPA